MNHTIEYIKKFIPDHNGKNFIPHVTDGLNTIESLEKIVDELFTPLKFSLVSIAVYHLGNNGTARKVLKEWTISQTAHKIIEDLKKVIHLKLIKYSIKKFPTNLTRRT